MNPDGMRRDLRAYFAGAWDLQREIEDRRAGQRGQLVGWALFKAEGGSLLYEESGDMTLGAARSRAYRRYRYLFPSPGRAEIRFEDGRLLVALDLAGGTAAASHLCGGDSYTVEVTLLEAAQWQTVWQVSGPRKDYRLVSRYRRPAESP